MNLLFLYMHDKLHLSVLFSKHDEEYMQFVVVEFNILLLSFFLYLRKIIDSIQIQWRPLDFTLSFPNLDFKNTVHVFIYVCNYPITEIWAKTCLQYREFVDVRGVNTGWGVPPPTTAHWTIKSASNRCQVGLKFGVFMWVCAWVSVYEIRLYQHIY